MNLKDLPNWRQLTEEERERIKHIYGQGPELTEEMENQTEEVQDG